MKRKRDVIKGVFKLLRVVVRYIVKQGFLVGHLEVSFQVVMSLELARFDDFYRVGRIDVNRLCDLKYIINTVKDLQLILSRFAVSEYESAIRLKLGRSEAVGELLLQG